MMRHILRPPHRQRGAALVIGLIFLVLLTLIGVAAMQATTLEERMAGNNRDRNVAFQATEVTLRDGELDIVCRNATRTGPCTRTMPISGLTGFNQNCTNGLCYKAGGFTTPVWQDPSLKTAKVQYGTYTGAVVLQGLASQPTYLIEGFRKWPPGSSGWKYYYRITASAAGANNDTQVNLQEVFVP